MSSEEQTLSIIKPDAVERDLVDKIQKKFIENHFKIIKSKKIQISKEEAGEFYKVHQTKPFYDRLCSYLSSGPIVVMILEKDNAIVENRKIMGIKEFDKKYNMRDIVLGDSIFCATGITSGDLVKGLRKKGNNIISETLVTHKSANLNKIITKEDTIKT